MRIKWRANFKACGQTLTRPSLAPFIRGPPSTCLATVTAAVRGSTSKVSGVVEAGPSVVSRGVGRTVLLPVNELEDQLLSCIIRNSAFRGSQSIRDKFCELHDRLPFKLWGRKICDGVFATNRGRCATPRGFTSFPISTAPARIVAGIPGIPGVSPESPEFGRKGGGREGGGREVATEE